jgi:DNA-directed RNA polymerase specialized sigma24 family protein
MTRGPTVSDSTDDDPGTVTVWLDQLKAGDPAAAGPIWRAYYGKLVQVARQRLRPVPNAITDEEDVALAAFKSFCQGVDDGRFPRLDDRDDLWKVLFDITTKKAFGVIKSETTLKKGKGKVMPASQVGDGRVDVAAGVSGREPSPAFAAEVAEECRRLLALLDTDQLRQIAVWKMEGYLNAEIAAKIDRSVPAVERKLALIRATWNRTAADPGCNT